MLVAYSQSSGATLIQCSDPSGAEENKAFIYDRNGPSAKAFEFRAGRFIRPDSLATAETEGISDKFGSVPLCSAANRRATAGGELLIAEKQPNNSQDAPYCYRIHYVVFGKSTLQITSDDGHEQADLSPAAIAEWTRLRENLSPYIDTRHVSAAPSGRTRVASVTSDKAPLFRSPGTSAPSSMYLVKGDQVEIVDASKLADGWCLVRYVTKSGKTIENWARTRDLNLPQK